MFSAIERCGKRLGSWKTAATPDALASSGLWKCTRVPFSRTLPWPAWISPVITPTRVDLPAPFSPTRAWISPGARSKVTSRSAWIASKLLETPRIDSRAGAAATSSRAVIANSPCTSMRQGHNAH